MSTNPRIRSFAAGAVLLLGSLELAGCDDEPPDGLIPALIHAAMGRALGCGELKCDGTNEANLAGTTNVDDIETRMDDLIEDWCPTYNPSVEVIAENSEFSVKSVDTYTVNISVVGQIRATVSSVSAKVKAEGSGFRAELTHSHSVQADESKSCPPQWPKSKCRVGPVKLNYESSDEINLSWVDNGGAKSASAEAGEILEGEIGVEEWCEYQPGGGTCGSSGGVPDGTGTDGRVACTNSEPCASLPCGEWFCDAGFCKQAQAAPDGTSCPGGTCAGGACVGS